MISTGPLKVELSFIEAVGLCSKAFGPGVIDVDALSGARRILAALAAAARSPELPMPEAPPAKKRGRPPGPRKPRQADLPAAMARVAVETFRGNETPPEVKP